MANPPTPTPKPPPAPAPRPPQNPPPHQPPAAAHAPEAFSKGPIPSGPKDPQDAKLELAERGARDRKVEPPVRTIADEQRERSEEMQTQGIDAWKAEHDERSADEKQPKVVPGVANRPVEEYEARGNSTPAARTAQHPAAPR